MSCRFAHSCYRLSKICATDEDTASDEEENASQWINVGTSVKIYLQCGRTFGMLSLECTCACCAQVYKRDYFFTLGSMDDIFINRMMPVVTHNGDVLLNLPDGTRGCFKPVMRSATSFNDEYILKKVLYANVRNPREMTLALLFETIESRIKSRAAFRVLKRSSRRARSYRGRIAALELLAIKGIDEVSLRIRIVRMAHLW